MRLTKVEFTRAIYVYGLPGIYTFVTDEQARLELDGRAQVIRIQPPAGLLATIVPFSTVLSMNAALAHTPANDNAEEREEKKAPPAVGPKAKKEAGKASPRTAKTPAAK